MIGDLVRSEKIQSVDLEGSIAELAEGQTTTKNQEKIQPLLAP